MGRHTQLERPASLRGTRDDAPPRGGAARPSPDDRPGPPPRRGPPLSWPATARAVLPAFLVTRLVTLVAGLVGAALWGIHDADAVYDPAGLTTGLGSVLDRVVAPYARWDAVWFLDIANQGYPTTYAPRTAFFPLYPVLINVVGFFLRSPLIAGLLISTACAYGGAMLLYRLTELELGRRAAGMAVWALLVFPGSLWLTAVYSEGLFLLLSAACLYFARERRWAEAAAVGALAAGTRSAGVVLVVPILLMAWQGRTRTAAPDAPLRASHRAPVDRTGRRAAGSGGLREHRAPLLAAAAVVGGLLVFVVGLRLAGHPWTVSFDQQQEWGRRNVGPVDGIVRAVRAAGDGIAQLLGSTDVVPAATPNAEWMNPLLLVFLVVGLTALAGAWRRLPPAYAAYAGAALLLPLSAPAVAGGEPLMSLPRFLGVLFPLAMWAGWWLTRGRWQRTRQAVLGVVGIGLLALVSELTARWLFVA